MDLVEQVHTVNGCLGATAKERQSRTAPIPNGANPERRQSRTARNPRRRIRRARLFRPPNFALFGIGDFRDWRRLGLALFGIARGYGPAPLQAVRCLAVVIV